MLKYTSRWLLSLLFPILLSLSSWADEETGVSHQLTGLQSVVGSNVVARRFIPSEQRRQGELRLVVDGSERRVQVLLYTESLGRALREMRKSEHDNWPEGKAWHPHSLKYLETLDAFRNYLRAKMDAAESGVTQRYNVMIELVDDGNDASIRFADVQYEGAPESLRVAGRQVYEQINFSGNYVSSNQFIMIRDGFELTPQQIQELMGSGQ